MSRTARSTLNASRTNPRGFSTLPARGALALVTTVLAVVLLFSFRPADSTTPLTGGVQSNAPLVGAAGATPANRAQPNPPQRTQPPVVAGPPAPTQRPGTTPRPPTPTPPAATAAGNNVSGTYTGAAEDTPYGTVQIALVVQDGKIVDVQELQLPNDRRLSQQISAQAGPMLRDQVLRAQGDNINGVSGASYTSYGFYLSLQSALQQM
jgi:uncharacterized protein with FMN-binding domain